MTTIKYDVPFFSNTADNLRCFQAGLKMIMKYFQPDRDYGWEELDQITARVEGLWTWPMAGMIWLAENSYEIHDIGLFDYERLVRDGSDYLIERYGEEIGAQQIEMSDLDQERRLAEKYLQKIDIKMRASQTPEIEEYLRDGYLVLCSLNSKVLNEEPGYSGHFVVVVGCDDNTFTLHNPGLPGQAHQVVSRQRFEKAWGFAGEKVKGFHAIKL